MTVDPNVKMELELTPEDLHVLSQQLGRRTGNKAITNEMAQIIKTQLRHTHFLDPLVSFVPLSDNV